MTSDTYIAELQWKLMAVLGVTTMIRSCRSAEDRPRDDDPPPPPGNNMCRPPTVKLHVLRHQYTLILSALYVQNVQSNQIVWSVLVAEQYFHIAKTIKVISGPAELQSLLYLEGDHLGIAGTQLSCKITFHVFAAIFSWFKAKLLCGRVFRKQ